MNRGWGGGLPEEVLFNLDIRGAFAPELSRNRGVVHPIIHSSMVDNILPRRRRRRCRRRRSLLPSFPQRKLTLTIRRRQRRAYPHSIDSLRSAAAEMISPNSKGGFRVSSWRGWGGGDGRGRRRRRRGRGGGSDPARRGNEELDVARKQREGRARRKLEYVCVCGAAGGRRR